MLVASVWLMQGDATGTVLFFALFGLLWSLWGINQARVYVRRSGAGRVDGMKWVRGGITGDD